MKIPVIEFLDSGLPGSAIFQENVKKKKRSIFGKKSKTPFKNEEDPYPFNNFQKMYIMSDLKYAKG